MEKRGDVTKQTPQEDTLAKAVKKAEAKCSKSCVKCTKTKQKDSDEQSGKGS